MGYVYNSITVSDCWICLRGVSKLQSFPHSIKKTQYLPVRLKMMSFTQHGASWWRHQIEHFPRYWPFLRGIHRSPVNSPHKGQWHGALIFFFICARINGWANNRKAGDLGRHSAHYDASVMCNQHTVCSNELYINWCIPCNGQTEYHFISDEFVVKYRSHLIGNDDNDAKDIKPQYNDIINGKVVILVIE